MALTVLHETIAIEAASSSESQGLFVGFRRSKPSSEFGATTDYENRNFDVPIVRTAQFSSSRAD